MNVSKVAKGWLMVFGGILILASVGCFVLGLFAGQYNAKWSLYNDLSESVRSEAQQKLHTLGGLERGDLILLANTEVLRVYSAKESPDGETVAIKYQSGTTPTTSFFRKAKLRLPEIAGIRINCELSPIRKPVRQRDPDYHNCLVRFVDQR